jgi:hypothetical protein
MVIPLGQNRGADLRLGVMSFLTFEFLLSEFCLTRCSILPECWVTRLFVVAEFFITRLFVLAEFSITRIEFPDFRLLSWLPRLI